MPAVNGCARRAARPIEAERVTGGIAPAPVQVFVDRKA